MSKYVILAGVTLLLTLTCIGLQGYHADSHCTNGCSEAIKKVCKEDAFGAAVSSNGSYTKCSWRVATSVIGLIMLVITFAFCALVFLKTRGKDFGKHVKITGCVIAPFILVTIALMISDLANGKKYLNDSGNTEGYAPGSYIANLILTFFIAILVAYVTFTGVGDKSSGLSSPKVSNTHNA